LKKGEKEGDPTKYVPKTIKEIIERIKEVACEGRPSLRNNKIVRSFTLPSMNFITLDLNSFGH